MNKLYLKSSLIRFSIIFFISIILIISSTLIAYNPPSTTRYTNDSFNFFKQPAYNESQFNIIFDLHSHTKYSDGILSIEQNILWHIAHGFNAMALTDHNTLWNANNLVKIAEKYRDQIVVIQGMEWTSDRIHMNLIGISEFVPAQSNPTDEEIQATINATHEQGGLVVVDHIPWSLPIMPEHPTRAQLLAWGVDYIELVNEWVYDYDSDSWCNNTGGFGKITGTDMHRPSNVHGWTFMKSQNFTVEGVMEQLLIRNTSILYDSDGQEDQSTYTNNARYKIVKPIIFFGEIFQGSGQLVDWQSVGISFSYLIIGFVIIEATVYSIKKYREKKKEE
ncbi:MAG: PHP domain-containing protein [Candidatus Heimdallarchaeota archaeon]|nr:PHP domain-containing protein [Candidatus Heimdallarchaeota archaeon]